MAAVGGGFIRPGSIPPQLFARRHGRPLGGSIALVLFLTAGLLPGTLRAAPAVLPASGPMPAAAPSSRLDPPGAAIPLVTLPADSNLIAGWADTILVEADRRPASPYPGGPVTVTVVPLEEATGGADLGELLARTAGLQIRRYGGLGAYVLPSIRGSTGAQVAVLVDGMPLAAAADGAVDLSDLPLERFAWAEVHRGGVPAGFGGGSGLGAINLVSRRGAASHLRLFAGSYGDVGGRWLGSWRAGGSRAGGSAVGATSPSGADADADGLTLLLHGRRLDNRYGFLDDRQTFAEPDDDVPARRRNAQFSEWGAWGSGRGHIGGVTAAGALGWYRRDGGRPGSLSYPSPHATAGGRRLDAQLSLATARDAVRLDLSATRQRDRLQDDLGEVGSDPRGTTRGGGDDVGARMSVSGGPRPGAALGVRGTVGADWRRQGIDWSLTRTSGGTLEQPRRTRTAVTGFASLRAELFGPRLALVPSLRWQQLTDDFPPLSAFGLPIESAAAEHVQTAWSPAVALSWEARPGRLFLEAHASRTVRPPSLTELRGDLGTVLGRLDLRPERLRAWDAGARGTAGPCDLRLVWFETRADDAIVFWPISGGWNQPRNLGATRTQGIEAEASGRWGGRRGGDGGGDGGDGGDRHRAIATAPATWRLALTWQDARDRGDEAAYRGRRLPWLPAFEGSATVEVPWARWRAGATATFLGASYRDRYNSPANRLPARTVLDLSLARSWDGVGRAGRLTATAEVINLTDRQVQDVLQYPLPGRSLRFSIRID